jgi:hypothetical protein
LVAPDASPPDAPVERGPWCHGQGGLTFCDDFDVEPLASKWSEVVATGGGAVTISSSHQASPPNALAASVSIDAPLGTAFVTKTFARTWTKLQLDFDLDAATDVSPTSPEDLVTVVALASDGFQVEFTMGQCVGTCPNDAALFAQFGACGAQSFGVRGCTNLLGVPASTWTHVRLSLDQPSGTLSQTVGTQPASSTSVIPKASSLTLRVGITNSPGGTSTVYVDNVALTLN